MSSASTIGMRGSLTLNESRGLVRPPRMADDRSRSLSISPNEGGRPMRIRHVLAAVAVSLALAAPAAAQTQITSGVIEGVVADTSGAVLPGVDVEVRNVETNLTRTLVSDRDGRFVALQLPPGRYTVTFKLAGFATLVQENVLATIGEAVRLSPVMKLSGVAETVTVTTEAATVETTRTAAASTLNEATIETTPILGRKF